MYEIRRPPRPDGDPQEQLRTTALYCSCELGWRLLPLLPGEKRPHTILLPHASWKELSRQSTTEEQINAWFRKDPTLNIGVITGPSSGSLAVVDVDHVEHLPRPFPVPPTPQSKTNRGFHAYFTTSVAPPKKTYPWGEILYGGYAVLPPSLHSSGIRYTWSDFLAPWEVEIAELPRGFLDPYAGAADGFATATPTSGITTEDLKRSFSSWSAVRACAVRLGVTQPTEGKPFRCVLPGHEERNPSASIYSGDNGVFMYHDFHQRSGPRCYTLGQVRAYQANGVVGDLSLKSSVHATWSLRLLVESGVFSPVPVSPLILPFDAPQHVRRVAEGFTLLLGCRWLYRAGEPAPLTRRFASAWCGVSEKQAEFAIRYLKMSRLIERVASTRGGYGETSLYLPSTLAKAWTASLSSSR